MSHELRFTDANFEKEVIKSDLPVLVDFWASWCPPCKMVEPVIRDLAEQYNGRAKIGKLNVDQNPKTGSKYAIQGVPTFIVFNSGKEIQRRTGAQSKAQLQEMLSEVL
jgi:thioredoxin 1